MTTAMCSVSLASALLAAAPNTEPKLKVPDAAALAPIVIPSVTLRQSAFAPELVLACTVLDSETAVPGTFSQAEFSDKGEAVRKNAARKLKTTCGRLSSGQQLTEGDLAALRAFHDNPSRIRANLQELFPSSIASKQGPSVTPSTSAGSFEAALINGLAQFIYDRAKEEAEVYVTKQLATLLCDDDVKPFFTNLCVVFGNTDPKISLSAMGSYLGAAARKDLQKLPDVSLAYGAAQLNDTNDADGGAREILFGARLGLAYYVAVSSGRTPLDVARSLHGIKPAWDDPSKRVLAAAAFASELVDAVTQQTGWQKLTDATPGKLDATCYALGALFSLDEIDAAKPFSKADFKLVAANVPVVVQFVLDLAALNARIEQAIVDISKPRDDSSGGFAVAAAVRRLTVKDYALITTQMLDRTLQDGLALAQTFKFIDDSKAAHVKHVRAVLALGEALVAGDVVGVVVTAATKLQEIDVTIKGTKAVVFPSVVEKVRNVTPLIAEMAQAKSADEVRAVLQAAAAPASAYENKYKGRTVALNALVGVASGSEGVENNGLKWGGFAGAFAPVGVHASIPLGENFHLGGFVSVINLGALVSARFKTDTSGTSTVQTDPNVSFANVLSPGAFLTLGLFHSPFIIGGGVQAVPASRQIQTTDASGAHTSSVAGVQVLGFLAVDVPLFMF